MTHEHAHNCSCCSAGLKLAQEAFARTAVSRRGLIAGFGSAVGAWALSGGAASAGEPKPESAAKGTTIKPSKELVVQPALAYHLFQRREQTSWRPWGGLMSESDVNQEKERIGRELANLAAMLPGVRMLPVAAVQTPDEAKKVAAGACDVMLVYAANSGEDVLTALMAPERPTLFFLRHKSGPISLYYEIIHPRFMRKGSDEFRVKGLDVHDVVTDNYGELGWRLQALHGLRKTLGQKIVAVGGAGGWGDGHRLAPPIARDKWHLDIIDVGYPELGKRIEKLRADGAAVAQAAKEAEAYLAGGGVTLKTDRKYVDNAFLLTRVFKDLMKENDATAMTIQHCMGTVMPISQTTACLCLSLINDEGMQAYCESDFVVIPAGMLMHNITGLPVFLNDPTYPHEGIVTIAHCTAPRKLDGKRLEPVEIHTHFESDYGAAPKVAMRKDQVVTNVIPDFNSVKYVGFKGKVIENPFHPICRSQTDITIDGDCGKLLEDMRGFHWMTVYGDCRREVGYAIKHLGIAWEDISA